LHELEGVIDGPRHRLERFGTIAIMVAGTPPC
jgi:hypothetical protein